MLQNAPSMVRNSTINASKRTIDGAKQHHQCSKRTSMVRNSTINASKRTVDGAKQHHQCFKTHR